MHITLYNTAEDHSLGNDSFYYDLDLMGGNRFGSAE